MQDLKSRYLAAVHALFTAYYAKSLNPKQIEAVTAAKGPLLVLAGAGSGKTTVLVRRIAHLIRYGEGFESTVMPSDVDEGYVKELEDAVSLTPEEIAYILPEFAKDACPPWNILAITFTNKAAKEIKERLKSTFEDETVANDIWTGTFHSICIRILRKYGDRVGYESGFSIYDTDDQKRLLLDCMKELDIDSDRLPVKKVASAISKAKDELLSPDDLEGSVSNSPSGRDILRVYRLYQKRLLAANALDFDDIIVSTVRLLSDYPDVLEYYSKKFRYVLVDEYQDTNPAQFRLTELLSSYHRNIMVVGDDDQSIYKFRGATIENILSFDRVYADARVVKLEQNYRSTKNILDAANAIIRKNRGRHEKSLWCDAEAGKKILSYTAEYPEKEARFIVDKITNMRVFEKHAYSDFAVLYRLNALTQKLEEAFAKSGIPYRVLGGQRFYDRKEIRDMTAYLNLVMNHKDDQRLKRIVNEPRRKIGEKAIDAVEAIAAELQRPMFDVMENADKYPALQKVAPRLVQFTRLIHSLGSADSAPADLLSRIFTETGYKEMLTLEGEPAQERIENINEFIGSAKEFEKRIEAIGETPTLRAYLEEISLVADVDKYDETADAVVLMTIHSAKGLEFPVVFLPAMEEGIFPSSQSLTNPGEEEEERRLAYVAVTRAKKQLILSRAKERMVYGRTQYNKPSPFLLDIPEELIEEIAPTRPDRAPYQKTQGFPDRKPAAPSYKKEASRSAFASQSAAKKPSAPLKELPVGTRVSHAIFGNGTVLSSKSVGGDVLYTVAFDNGQEKRLMASFAKLNEI